MACNEVSQRDKARDGTTSGETWRTTTFCRRFCGWMPHNLKDTTRILLQRKTREVGCQGGEMTQLPLQHLKIAINCCHLSQTDDRIIVEPISMNL